MLTTIRQGILLVPLVVLGVRGTLATTVSSPSADVPPQSECEAAATWVAENVHYLPTTEAALAPFSIVYRRAIYRALPVTTQRELWRQHLGSFLMDESALTAKQRKVVKEAVDNLDYFFDPRVDRAARAAAAKAFVDRNSVAFPRPLQVAVFARLGPPQPEGQSLLSVLAERSRAASYLEPERLSTEVIATNLVNESKDVIVCECNVASQDCPGEECYDGTSTCSLTEQGCGPMLLFECDGLCGALPARQRVRTD